MGAGEGDPHTPREAAGNETRAVGAAGLMPVKFYRPVDRTEQITIPPDWQPLSAQPAWRLDFPIDTPQDDYVARRDFMKFMVLTSLAFTAGQFWIGAQSWLRRRRGLPPIVRVASLDELRVGSWMTFTYPEPQDSCVLVRPSEGTLVSYSQKCTHLSCAVIPRPGEGVIHCPCHEGWFDLQSGAPIAGPPSRPLPRILLDVRGRDVFATGVELRTT